MRIGITGGIGSGKSAVTAYLRSLGETVICADEVARQVVEPGQPGVKALRSVFGDGFFHADGSLDRKALAHVVFSDSQKRKQLDDTLHPLIVERILYQANSVAGRVFIDAALLIQTGLNAYMDAVWLVTADVATRISRVMQRDSVDEQSVLMRISSQPEDEWMSRSASEIISNDSSLSALHSRIDKLLSKYNEENCHDTSQSQNRKPE